MTDDTNQLIDELKRVSIEDQQIIVRKLWYTLIQALHKINALETEIDDIKYRYQQRTDIEDD